MKLSNGYDIEKSITQGGSAINNSQAAVRRTFHDIFRIQLHIMKCPILPQVKIWWLMILVLYEYTNKESDIV